MTKNGTLFQNRGLLGVDCQHILGCGVLMPLFHFHKD